MAEYLALCGPLATSASPESTSQPEGIHAEDDPTVLRAQGSVSYAKAERVDVEGSLKALVRVYGRTVDILREKRERELLTEALSDLGDLHVSKLDNGYSARHKLHQHMMHPTPFPISKFRRDVFRN